MAHVYHPNLNSPVHPLFDTSPLPLHHSNIISHTHHRHLSSIESSTDSDDESPSNSQSTSQLSNNDDPSNSKHIRQQMHEPESEEINPDKPNTNDDAADKPPNPEGASQPNKLPQSPSNNAKKDNPKQAPAIDSASNANDIDAILEQQMQDEAVQRQLDLEIQIETQNREHNILKFYIFILVQSIFITMHHIIFLLTSSLHRSLQRLS